MVPSLLYSLTKSICGNGKHCTTLLVANGAYDNDVDIGRTNDVDF